MPAAQAEAVYPIMKNATAIEMTSKTDRTFKIFMAWPETPPPAEGYPVIYTLDADYMFATMVDTIRSHERRPGGTPALIVGIGYPDGVKIGEARRLDLTPAIGSEHPEGTGGAEDLIHFISDELKPDIASRFPVNTDKEVLFGHSFGGLFTLYTLINRPELFDTFIAASPSIWFEDELIKRGNVRKRLEPKLEVLGVTPRVLITVGENEQADDPDFPHPNLERLLSISQVDNARDFADFIDELDGVSADFELLPGEDHGTVIPVAIARGARFVFSKTAETPAPATPVTPYDNQTGVPVYSAADYLALTPEERYAHRLQARALPADQREGWLEAFDFALASGLTYGEHRALHEERVRMDEEHATASPEGD